MKKYNMKLIALKIVSTIFASLNIFFMIKLIILILSGPFSFVKLFSICICSCSCLYGFITLYFTIFRNNELIQISNNK